MAPPRNVRQTFRSYSMLEFCRELSWTVSAEGQSGWLGYFSAGRVIDKTGIDGAYDFTLEFAGRFQSGANPTPLPGGETDTAPNLFDALKQQLGLKLEEKGPLWTRSLSTTWTDSRPKTRARLYLSNAHASIVASRFAGFRE